MANWYWEAATVQNQALYADRDGTLAKPWVLGPQRFGINAGAMDVSVFNPGDTLWILDEHAWLNFDDSAIFTSLDGLTIRGSYPERAGHIRLLSLVDCTNINVYALDLTLLTLDGTSDTVIDACTMHDSSDEGIRVEDDAGGDRVVIKNCTIHDCEKQGIELFTLPGVSRDGWVISNNHIYNIGLNTTHPDADLEAIGLQRVTNCIIRDNHIHDADYGINLYESGAGISHDVTICENNIHDITGGPITWPSRGIFTSGGTETEGSLYNIKVHRNIIDTVGEKGIRLQAPPNATGLHCWGNTVTNTGGTAVDLAAEWLTTSTSCVCSANRKQISRRRR